jgi:hypothetical protein
MLMAQSSQQHLRLIGKLSGRPELVEFSSLANGSELYWSYTLDHFPGRLCQPGSDLGLNKAWQN